MRLLLLLLLLPVVLLVSIIVFLAIPLPSGTERTAFSAIGTGIVAACYLIGLLYYVILNTSINHKLSQLGESFDKAFENAGLATSQRGAFSRTYEGTMQEMPASVKITPPFHLQPWRIEIRVHAKPSTMIAIGSSRPLLDCRDAGRLLLDDPDLAEVHIHPKDENQGRELVDNIEVKSILIPLIASLSNANSWEIYIQSEQVWARIRTYQLEEEAIKQLLDLLPRLTVACENS